jgi:hypothetical protein
MKNTTLIERLMTGMKRISENETTKRVAEEQGIYGTRIEGTQNYDHAHFESDAEDPRGGSRESSCIPKRNKRQRKKDERKGSLNIDEASKRVSGLSISNTNNMLTQGTP